MSQTQIQGADGVAGGSQNTAVVDSNNALRVTTVGAGTQTTTVTQGAPNTDANGWPVKVTDGTNGDVTVKPASTAAVAADKSFVVAFSPNSPIPAGSNVVGTVKVGDGTNTVSVFQFHNTDNQILGTVYGLNTGGVAQLVNASNNVDRQRATSSDVVPGLGIASGSQQLAWGATLGPVTSGAITGSGTAQTITMTNVSGTTNGVAWKVAIGSTVVLDVNLATQEAFTVTAVAGSTVTGVIKNNHGASATATTFWYDQARSAMIPDGSTGQGIAAGGTYLFNANLNAGSGGWESERSAAGEKDGATGTGTNIAAEYECSSGGPILASGLASGLQFDRARNVNGKGVNSQTITSSTAGNTTIVYGSAAATNLVGPGVPIQLTGSGTTETVYSTNAWVPGSSATVPLQSPVVNTGQTTAKNDIYVPSGPGTGGFLPYGLGLEEEALHNPVDGLYYQARSATADGMAAPNLPAEAVGLWNSATFDRWKSAYTGAALVSTGQSTSFTTLNAVTATGAGSTEDLGAAFVNFSLVLTGTSTSTTVALEGSVDNVNFFQLAVSGTNVSLASPVGVTSTGRPVRYIRGNVTALGNGNVTGKIMAA